MAEETRTRFAWTWAGLLAGVLLVGASYGSRAQPARGESPAGLAQLEPSTPGTPPTPGLPPPPATTPSLGGEDAGVGGSGFVPPTTTPTGPDAGYGTSPDAGLGGSGLPPPTVGGLDGGLGF